MPAGNLGYRTATGALSTRGYYAPGTNLWVVTFKPQDMPQSAYEVWHGFARGPGGSFLVYIDNRPFGVGENGTLNEYAPQIPMLVMPGQTITCNWSIATGSAPTVTLDLREPEVGRI